MVMPVGSLGRQQTADREAVDLCVVHRTDDQLHVIANFEFMPGHTASVVLFLESAIEFFVRTLAVLTNATESVADHRSEALFSSIPSAGAPCTHGNRRGLKPAAHTKSSRPMQR